MDESGKLEEAAPEHAPDGDPDRPHAFLPADTYLPIGPFSGGGAAIRGLLAPQAVETGRADHCALCGRAREDAIHFFQDD